MHPIKRSAIRTAALSLALLLTLTSTRADAHGHGGGGHHAGRSTHRAWGAGSSSGSLSYLRGYVPPPSPGYFMPTWSLSRHPTPRLPDDLPAARFHHFLSQIFEANHGGRPELTRVGPPH